MASIRERKRADGTVINYSVLYTLDKRQTSLPFDNLESADKFKDLVNNVGPARALEIHGINPAPRRRTADERAQSMPLSEWLNHHIDHLTGVDKRTRDDYRGYVRNAPTIGVIPLRALSTDDVSRWVQGMELAGAAAKTIANKHGFLSAALAAAVAAGHIGANPAAGTRLPRDEPAEMLFLERDDFTRLLAEIPQSWRPLAEFLVTSGCRWSEATALKPSDIDRARSTVRISRAWKRGPYRIGPTKTRKSVRTINVPKSVLDKLTYTGLWLFTNPGQGDGGPSPLRRGAGGPVRAPNFRQNVWNPAVARTWPTVDEHGEPIPNALRPRIHDLRHTCVSWLIAAGRPLPAIQQHLGHESITTTVDRYGHLDRSSGQGNADALAAMLD